MPVRLVLSPLAAFAVVLLNGCIGKPQTFYAAKPIAWQQRVTAPGPTKPGLRAGAPTLSANQKQRLFQGFQQQQAARNQTITDQALTP